MNKKSFDPPHGVWDVMFHEFSSIEEKNKYWTKGWLECPYCRKVREEAGSVSGKVYYFLRHHQEVECPNREGANSPAEEHKNVTPGDLEAAEIHHLRKGSDDE